MIGSATEHATFVIERRFTVPPARVFNCWASAEAKKRWFSCDDAMVATEFSLDFRPGGRGTEIGLDKLVLSLQEVNTPPQ